MSEHESENDVPAEPNLRPFQPDQLFSSQTYKLTPTRSLPCLNDADLFVITNDRGEPEELAYKRPGAPTLFLKADGSVRELNPAGELVETGTAQLAKGYDCDAAVRWAIQHGMNSAFTECIRALCKHLNCKHAGSCGGSSPFEREQAARYLCTGVIASPE